MASGAGIFLYIREAGNVIAQHCYVSRRLRFRVDAKAIQEMHRADQRRKKTEESLGVRVPMQNSSEWIHRLSPNLRADCSMDQLATRRCHHLSLSFRSMGFGRSIIRADCCCDVQDAI